MEIKFSVVTMSEVPPPPIGGKLNISVTLYEQIRKLGFGERSAVCLEVGDEKTLKRIKFSLRSRAKADGLLLCTSRTRDNAKLYCWLVKPEAKPEAKPEKAAQ